LQQRDGYWTNGHLRFDPLPPRPNGYARWAIRLASSLPTAQPIGFVKWHGLWREFVLSTCDGYIFAPDCLRDIAQFCVDRTAFLSRET
jgi:hypothetical protein